ncbi:MAG: TlpA family protein disulfide reductase [Acidimicrobiia bacterium]|nr:TlpA family protein disulfide reductase [Acidimicrobiia bacterium]
MLKRNMILSILFVIISITYFTYSNTEIKQTPAVVNSNVNLYSLTEVSNIENSLKNESFIVLNLWASWCITCIEEVEELKKISLDEKYYVIGVLVDDSKQNGQEFIKKYNVNYENILSEDDIDYLLAKFNWTGIPTSLVLNLDYEVIQTISGQVSYKMISELTE